MEQPLTVSVSEAAQRIGVGRGTAYALVRSGELASITYGKRSRRVPVAAIEQYVQRALEGSTSERA